MSTPTAARPNTESGSSHWYYTNGLPCYELPKKAGAGTKSPTLADARKLNLLPSVTTILKILNKPALTNWMIEQAVLAAMTSPRREGEELDAFLDRILHQEKVQEQEAGAARDRGTEIHEALERLFTGQEVTSEIDPWVRPAYSAIVEYGALVATEKILTGPGYAGKTDLLLEAPGAWVIFDYKSAKKLPEKEPWPEHKLQLSAYAKAYKRMMGQIENAPSPKPIQVANCYISTVEMGKFIIHELDEWETTYQKGFAPLVEHWCWATGYSPVITPAWEDDPREEKIAALQAELAAIKAKAATPEPAPQAPVTPPAEPRKKQVVWTKSTATKPNRPAPAPAPAPAAPPPAATLVVPAPRKIVPVRLAPSPEPPEAA